MTAQQRAQRHILRHPSMMPPGPAGDPVAGPVTFRDGKVAYYRGTEDTAQTQAVLQA